MHFQTFPFNFPSTFNFKSCVCFQRFFTCIASKVLEHIVHSHVMKHLLQYGVLTGYQHSYRAKQSTETQLICVVYDVASALQCNSAIFDFSKEFNKVCHRQLLKKLDNNRIHGLLHNWSESFLTEHSQ